MANTVEVTIKGIDDATNVFTKVSKEADQAMDAVEESIKDVPDLDVDAEQTIQQAKKAEDAVEGVMAQLMRIPKEVRTQIKVSTKQFNRQMAGVMSTMMMLNTVISNVFSGGMMMFFPALIPIIATLTAGIGGLASAFAAAGAGAVAFGSVAVTVLNDVFQANEKINQLQKQLANTSDEEKRAEILKKIEQAQSGLTQAQQEGLTALQQFSKFWNQFAMQFQEPILDIFIRSLKQAEELIRSLKGAFKGSIGAFNSLSQSLSKAFKSDDVQAFIDMINAKAGPMIRKFGKIFGNIIRGIMNLMVQFAPTGTKIVNKILELSQAFVEWSSTLETNKGFQTFMSYVKQVAPIVINFFSQLIQFGMNLMVALAPLGQTILKLATQFLSWTNSLIKNNQWIVKVTAIVISLMGAFKILFPIIMLGVTIFRTVGGIISKILPIIKRLWLRVGTKLFLAFQNIIGVIGRVLPWILRIGKFLLRFVNPVTAVISIVITLGIIIYKNWDKIKKWTIQTWNAMKVFIEALWLSIKAKAIQIFANIMIFIANIWNSISGTAKTVWNGLMIFLGGLWNGISSTVSSVFNGIANTITGVWNSISSATSSIWDGIVSTITGAINNVIGAINSMLNAISGISISIPSIPEWVPGLGGMGGGSIGFPNIPNIPNIPKLAEGGKAIDDTLAMIGEGSDDEAILPLNRTVMADLAGRIGKHMDVSEGESIDYKVLADSIGEAVAIRLLPVLELIADNESRNAMINFGGYQMNGLIDYITKKQERIQKRNRKKRGQ